MINVIFLPNSNSSGEKVEAGVPPESIRCTTVFKNGPYQNLRCTNAVIPDTTMCHWHGAVAMFNRMSDADDEHHCLNAKTNKLGEVDHWPAFKYGYCLMCLGGFKE